MTTATQLQPGIHFGIPFGDYADDPGLNHSLFDHPTGAHLLYAIGNPREDTPTFRVGRGLHYAVLEPDLFESHVVVRPEFKGEGAHARRDLWNMQHEGSVILTPGEMEDVEGMGMGVSRQPKAARVLEDAAGHSEATVIWVDAATGIRCKARLDRYIPGRLVLDVKHSGKVHVAGEDFAWHFYNLNYHRQLAWYRRGLRACGDTDTPWTIIACEGFGSYEAAIYNPDPDWFTLGENDAATAFARLSKVILSGEWRGYSQEVQTLELPDGLRKQRRLEL